MGAKKAEIKTKVEVENIFLGAWLIKKNQKKKQHFANDFFHIVWILMRNTYFFMN